LRSFGEPDIATYGKNYGQGPYFAYNYLGESGALFFLRALPDNAAYSNIRIDALLGAGDTTASMQITYIDGINAETEFGTNLQNVGSTYPICFIYPIGRGQWYNKLSIRLTEVANPTLWDTYILDIYERQSDGQDVIIESFEVSFDPKARDTAGDSIWIVDILNLYSAVLNATMYKNEALEQFSAGYDENVKVYDKDIGTTSVVLTGGSASITDNKQDFVDWETGNPSLKDYTVTAKDARGNEIWGWLGVAGGTDNDTITVFSDRALTTQSWNGATTTF